MPDIRLPPVDPDFHIVERDRAKLDAYARGLLAIAEGPRRRGDRYTRKVIRAAVCWLVDSYAVAAAPVPHELARLVRRVIGPTGGARSSPPVQDKHIDAWWAMVDFERRQPRASAYAVARHLLDKGLLPSRGAGAQKSAEKTVKEWRARRMEGKSESKMPP